MPSQEGERPTKRRRTNDHTSRATAAAAHTPHERVALAARPVSAAQAAAAEPPPALPATSPSSSKHPADAIQHILYVRWFGGRQGETRLNKLQLRHLDHMDELEELSKELVERDYPTGSVRLPQYCTEAYSRFTPTGLPLALPGEVMRTEVRLVLLYRGWEYTVLREDVTHRQAAGGGDHNVHLMTSEFLGAVDPIMAALGLRTSLVAYPVVAVKKSFLDDVHERMLAAPDSFKGML